MDATGNEIRPYTASPKDVAEHFGVTRTTVYNWLDSDNPPPHRRVGSLIRFNLAELDEWSKARVA